MKVFKQVLDITGMQTIKLPIGFKILSLANQNENLCLWYLCDPEMENEEIEIFIFGTGHEVGNFTGQFLGTVLMHNNQLVWHVFKGI